MVESGMERTCIGGDGGRRVCEKGDEGRERASVEGRVSSVESIALPTPSIKRSNSQMPNPVHHQLLHRLHTHLKLLLRSLARILPPVRAPRIDCTHLGGDEVEEIVDHPDLVGGGDGWASGEFFEKAGRGEGEGERGVEGGRGGRESVRGW